MGAIARRPVTARPLILRQSKSAAPTSCKPRLQAAERAPASPGRDDLRQQHVGNSPQSSPVSLSRSAEMIISANRPPRKPRAVCAASAGNHGLANAPFFAFFLDNLQFDRYNNPSPAEQAGGLYIKLSFCGSDASDPLFFGPSRKVGLFPPQCRARRVKQTGPATGKGGRVSARRGCKIALSRKISIGIFEGIVTLQSLSHLR